MIEDDIEQLRQDVSMALDAADSNAISKILNSINVTQISNLLDSLPSQQRDLIWPQIDPAWLGAVLLETGDEVRDNKLGALGSDEIANIIESLADVDDHADIILSLPTDKLVDILHTLDAQKRKKLESVLSYWRLFAVTQSGIENQDSVFV